jgi:hypothetical protein
MPLALYRFMVLREFNLVLDLPGPVFESDAGSLQAS